MRCIEHSVRMTCRAPAVAPCKRAAPPECSHTEAAYQGGGHLGPGRRAYQHVGGQGSGLGGRLQMAKQDAVEGKAGGCIDSEVQRLQHQALHPDQVLHLRTSTTCIELSQAVGLLSYKVKQIAGPIRSPAGPAPGNIITTSFICAHTPKYTAASVQC